VLISPSNAGRVKKTVPRKSAAITLTEVAALPLILPSRPNAFRILIETELSALGFKPNITLEVDGLNGILNLVAEGLGHAVLPAYTLSNFDDTAPFLVRSIQGPCIMSRLELVWSSRRPTTPTQRQALEVLKKVVLSALAD
jgi:LysR family transcriptional regulator, nitrogen assimilation regulatory protein